MKRRSGHSLIECLVAMTLMGAAFTTVTVSLHGMVRSERRVREEFRAEQALRQLAAQLRSDAHLATKAELGQGSTPATALVLTMPANRTAQYTLQPRQIERVVKESGQLRHRESYYLPRTWRPAWQIGGSSGHPMVALVLEADTAASAGAAAPRPVRIDAAVGLLSVRSGGSQP